MLPQCGFEGKRESKNKLFLYIYKKSNGHSCQWLDTVEQITHEELKENSGDLFQKYRMETQKDRMKPKWRYEEETIKMFILCLIEEPLKKESYSATD